LNKLDELESRIQRLIEQHLILLIRAGKAEDLLSQKLAAAMYAQIYPQDGNGYLAPNVYMIIAHSLNINRWMAQKGFIDELIVALEKVGEQAGLGFSSRPVISTSFDESLTNNEVQVLASFTSAGLSETQGMIMPTEFIVLERKNTFLIFQNGEVTIIDKPVMNIGRSLDNHIIIDDTRVSRNHAQIRNIKGRFVLFDLNSTGGTFVNNEQINQMVIFPGDVISLAGVALVFGQDIDSNDQEKESTQPNTSISSEQKPIQKRIK
jgi:pSer/pThr/pTyr-binding forkhead associated (FHA) protein